MNFKHLTALKAVIDAEGFSAAAESLSITQSSLTKMIAQLEEELGVKLFERGGGRRAQPTRYGQIVYDRGAAIVSDAEELKRYLTQVKRGYSQLVRIGFGVSIPTRRISIITEQLRRKMPQSSLRIRTEMRHHLMSRLRKKEFDFLVIAGGRGDDAEDLTVDRLWEDRFCVFMSNATYDLARDHPDGAPLQWLASDRLAEMDTQSSKFLDGFLSRASYAQIDAYDRHVIAAMLDVGPFISAWPFETFADEVERGEMAMIEIPEINGRGWNNRVNLVSLKGPQSSRIAASARQFLKRMEFS